MNQIRTKKTKSFAIIELLVYCVVIEIALLTIVSFIIRFK